jgi:hypothetical protein
MNETANNKEHAMTNKTVKILGYTVRVGSKKHAILSAQVKHFNDLTKGESK